MEYGKRDLFVRGERLEIEAAGEALDTRDVVENVLEVANPRSERKRRLALDALAQPVLADRLGDDIDGAPKDLAQALRQVSEAAEIGEAALACLRGQAHDDIDIGIHCGVAASHRAEQRKAFDAGGAQLRLVGAQDREGVVPIHDSKVRLRPLPR